VLKKSKKKSKKSKKRSKNSAFWVLFENLPAILIENLERSEKLKVRRV